jgi:hypothetical protein
MLLVTSNVCEFKREGAVVHPGYFYLVFKSLIEIGLLTDRNPSPAKSKHQSSAQNGRVYPHEPRGPVHDCGSTTNGYGRRSDKQKSAGRQRVGYLPAPSMQSQFDRSAFVRPIRLEALSANGWKPRLPDSVWTSSALCRAALDWPSRKFISA